MITVTVSSTDLYRLAAQYYGDSSQWYRIAAQNDLADPVIVGAVTLGIPPVTQNLTNGGILMPIGSVSGGAGALFGKPYVPPAPVAPVVPIVPAPAAAQAMDFSKASNSGLLPAIIGI